MGHIPSCSLQPSGSLPLVQRLWDREGTCGVESSPQALGPQFFSRDPQHVPGTAAGLLVDGSDRCTNPSAQAQRRLVQTLSSCRPTGTSVLAVLERLLTRLHSSHTSAHVHICTHCTHVHMHVIYMLTYVLHMLLCSHTHLHSTCLLTRSMVNW